jgi:hypothetical protein
MKVTVATTSAARRSGAKLKAFDVKASTVVEGFTVTCTVKPATPSVSFEPKVRLNTKPISATAEATVAKDGVTLFLDNLQDLSKKKFAPRVKAERKVTVSGKAYAVDAELALKGNVKTADVVTVSVKAPAVAGFVPKASYSTGPKGASVTMTGDVGGGDTNVELKAEHFPKKAGANVALTATVTQKLPEKMKAKLTLKDDLSGSVELHKGAAFLEAPLGKGGKPPGVGDVVFKYKKTFEYDL